MHFEMKYLPETGEVVIRLGNDNSVDNVGQRDGAFRAWKKGGVMLGRFPDLQTALYAAYTK